MGCQDFFRLDKERHNFYLEKILFFQIYILQNRASSVNLLGTYGHNEIYRITKEASDPFMKKIKQVKYINI